MDTGDATDGVPADSSTSPASATDEGRSERLPHSSKIWFGLPTFAGAAMGIPIGVHMPRFYSDEILAPIGYIAVAMAVARALDALTDPIVGWLSDRTRTRLGRRLPWITIGVPLSAVAFFGLFSPPGGLTGVGAALWFAGAFGVFYVLNTMVVVPHSALGAELTLDYGERSSLFGYQALFSTAGVLVGVTLPWLLQTDESVGIREAYRIMGALYGVALVFLYAPFVLRLRERPEFVLRKGNPLAPGVRRALRNRPFRILLAAAILYAIPSAIPGIMTPYHTYYVLQPENPEWWMMVYLVAYFAMGLAFLPMWVHLAGRLGKLGAYLIAAFIGATSNLLYFFPGPGDMLFTLGINLYSGVQSAAFFALIPAMSADAIDYDEFRTGKRREGQLSAFWTIIPKFVAIPSASVPLAVLASVGYTPNAAQTPEVVFAIRFIYGIFPTFFFVAGMTIMFWYPISRGVHAEIQEGIAVHAAGGGFPDPITGEWFDAPGDGTDEAVGWQLDYFSTTELRRSLEGGPRQLVRSVFTCFALAVTALAVSCTLAVRSVADPSVNPGLLAVIWIVAAGLSLTATAFHAARLRPALRLVAAPVPRNVVKEHLRGANGHGRRRARRCLPEITP